MSIRRKHVIETYADIIGSLYGDVIDELKDEKVAA
jgi:hypothetical protein